MLEIIKESYSNDYYEITNFYEYPKLSIDIIQNDIDTYNLFIEQNHSNAHSNAYFNRIKFVTIFYEFFKKKLNKINKPVNYAEEFKKYLQEPTIINIEKEQMQIYALQMFVYYEHAQFNIWNTIFFSIEKFTEYRCF